MSRFPVAYMMSRFPKLSETFILREMLGLRELGAEVHVFPLILQKEEVVHPEVKQIESAVHYQPLFCKRLFKANLRWLAAKPRAYLLTWLKVALNNRSTLKSFFSALAVTWKSAGFAEEIRNLKLERIHAHWATHPALAAYVVNRLTGIPYSFTSHAHDLYMKSERNMLRDKILSSDFCVTISNFNRDLIRRLCGDPAANKTQVVRLGVDLSMFAPPESKPPPPPLNIVCVAALRSYKGHEHLVKACFLLSQWNIPFTCHLVGEGETRPTIEAAISQHGLGGRVLLHGAKPWSYVRDMLSKAHCFALPSVITSGGMMEGIPVALMEAMAMACPVVATDLSGVPELVEDGVNGRLVPPGDARALAEAIAGFHRNPASVERMGKAARSTIEDRYNLNHNIRSLYELISGNGKTRADEKRDMAMNSGVYATA